MDVSVEANTANPPDNVEQLKANTLAEMAEFLVPEIQPKTTTDIMPVLTPEVIKNDETSEIDQQPEIINEPNNVQTHEIIENPTIPVSEPNIVQNPEQQTDMSIQHDTEHSEINTEQATIVEEAIEQTEVAEEQVIDVEQSIEHPEQVIDVEQSIEHPEQVIDVEESIEHPEVTVEHVLDVEQAVEHNELAVEQTEIPVEHAEIPAEHVEEIAHIEQVVQSEETLEHVEEIQHIDHVVQSKDNLEHADNSVQESIQNSDVNLEHTDISIVQAEESMEEASLEQADQSIDSLDQSIASSTEIPEEVSDQSSEQITQGSISEVYEEHITGESNIEEKMNLLTEDNIKQDIKVDNSIELKDEIVEVGKLVEYEEEEYEEAMTDQETLVVVTSGDTQTKEIVVRTADGREGTVTVQQVTDENGQVYLVETVNNVLVMEEEDSQDNIEYMVQQQPPPNMPSHVLGRNITNPSLDPFRNGKAPPKPRLGVKIPYRNLTSQIVSKQEITAEILQRCRRNNKEQPVGQNLFAKKLTQTLAKKLAPSKKASSESGTSNKVRKETETLNNSDLIAILEGDDGDIETEPEPPKEIVKAVEMTKELEREIALKQLSELPDDPPPVVEKPEIKTNRFKDLKIKKVEEEKIINKVEEIPVIRKAKKSRFSDNLDDDLPKNPRFSSNVPLKTYTRKRKPSEELQNTEIIKTKSPITDSNSTKKIDLPVNTKSYITKSSRVIKKKIIWDPDEATPKKLMKGTEIPIKEKLLMSAKKENEEGNRKIKTEEGRRSEKGESVKKVEVLKKVQDSSSKQESPKNERKVLVKSKELRSETKMNNERLAALKNKKRLTEVDKLLMDEGAVNMLYTLKGTEEDQHKKKPNKSLMSKTNELLNDLQTNTDKVSPKALRKKDGTPITIIKSPKKVASPVPNSVSRQKSRDSIRSSLHSPPGSPGPVYMADASRIIRRHSSSSFSSEEDDSEEKSKTKKTEVRAVGRRKAEIIENPKKKLKKEDLGNSNDQKDEDVQSKFNKLVENEENVNKYDKFKTFSVKKLDQLIQIILSPNVGNNVFINIEMMQELSVILKELEQDCECNLTVITSAGAAFMKGIKFKNLIAAKETTRKNLAKKLATNIRDFLLSLANFPKVIVAGVHGDVVGLGVTMLPLFDMVVASDSATFGTPYAKLGCIAEGGSLLSLPHLSQNVLVSELLFSSRKLVCEEALKLGLVTKLLWPDKFQDEIIPILKVMSNQSAQFMEGTKKQLRHRMIPEITAALNSETETLVQQWISPECQKNFSSN